jgi:hypothetical protein
MVNENALKTFLRRKREFFGLFLENKYYDQLLA